MRWLVIVVTLGACEEGDDASRPDASSPPDAPIADAAIIDVFRPDAQPVDLSCVGQPLPTTAPDPLTITGTVGPGVPIAGATVELRARAGDAVLATAVTGAAGEFTLTAPTGGVPLAAYLHASAAGRWATRRYYARDFAADVTLPALPLFTFDEVMWSAANVGVTQTGTHGSLLFGFHDCAATYLADVVVSAGFVPYYFGDFQNPPLMCRPIWGLERSTVCGLVQGFQIVPGTYTLDGERPGLDFPPQPVRVDASAVTIVTLQVE